MRIIALARSFYGFMCIKCWHCFLLQQPTISFKKSKDAPFESKDLKSSFEFFEMTTSVLVIPKSIPNFIDLAILLLSTANID